MSNKKAENMDAEVASVLALAGIDRPPVDVEAVAQRLGLQLVRRDMEDATSGMLVRGPRYSTIAVNAGHHPRRQRFTIAHEIGHFQLHWKSTETHFIDYVVRDFRDDRSSTATDKREIEANQFAASLLMPREFLRKDLRGQGKLPGFDVDEGLIVKLARRYEVSQQAMIFRLINLGYIVSDGD